MLLIFRLPHHDEFLWHRCGCNKQSFRNATAARHWFNACFPNLAWAERFHGAQICCSTHWQPVLGRGSYGLFVIEVREADLVRSALEVMSSMMAHWTMAEGESYSPAGSMTNVFTSTAAHFALPPCVVRSSDFSWESRCWFLMPILS